MSTFNYKALGNTKIDKTIYQIYGKEAGDFDDDVLDFWQDYIKSIKSKAINLDLRWKFIDIYSKMMLNIMGYSFNLYGNADQTFSYTNHLWYPRSQSYVLFFEFVVKILKMDMRCTVFQYIIKNKRSDFFEVYCNARLSAIGINAIFENDIYEDTYDDYLFWRDHAQTKTIGNNWILLMN